MRKKIYCFNNGGQPGLLLAVAVCEDGHCLAQHVCSSEGFMPHDLGMVGTWKHDIYNSHCGEGNWELEWVPNPKEHEGLKEAFRLNQEWMEAEAPAGHSNIEVVGQAGTSWLWRIRANSELVGIPINRGQPSGVRAGGKGRGRMPKELNCRRCDELEEAIHDVSMMLAGDGYPSERDKETLRRLGKVMNAEACARWGV